MIKISAEISLLNKEQREALAGFIMTFPPAQMEIDEIVKPAGETQTPEPSPVEAFGTPSPAPNTTNVVTMPAAPEVASVSSAGPVLVIPPAEVPAAPVANGATQLDKAGLPWDERIHAGSKSVTADGLWRKKRGITDELVASVEAQLRSLMSLPSPAPVPTLPAPAAVPAPPPANPIVAVAEPIPAAGNSVPVASANSAPAPAVDPKAAFVALVSLASSSIQAGKLTQAELQAACNSVGVETLPLLANRLDLVPAVKTLIESTLAGR